MTHPDPVPVFGRSRAPDLAWLAKAEPEPALEPDLPIVDAHLHAWHKPGHRYMLEDYTLDLAASGHKVVATVAEECGAMYRTDGPAHLKCVGETEFLVGQAAMAASGQYTQVKVAAAIVAFADLTLGERTDETLQAHLAVGNGRVKAIRQNAKWDPDPAITGIARAGLYLEPAFNAGMKRLVAHDLAFDASVYHHQLDDVLTLAQAQPEARIVLIHSGSPLGYGRWGGRADEVHESWLAGMKALARCPNVHMKIGGLLIHLASFDYTRDERPPNSQQLADMWRPYIEPCIELFGADRCIAAANFPVENAGATYGTIWNMFKRITQNASADEKRWIYGDTARRVYRME